MHLYTRWGMNPHLKSRNQLTLSTVGKGWEREWLGLRRQLRQRRSPTRDGERLKVQLLLLGQNFLEEAILLLGRLHDNSSCRPARGLGSASRRLEFGGAKRVLDFFEDALFVEFHPCAVVSST